MVDVIDPVERSPEERGEKSGGGVQRRCPERDGASEKGSGGEIKEGLSKLERAKGK